MRVFVAGLLLVLIVALPLAVPAAAPRPISLKSFIDWEQWQLDVTWSAKDQFEDRDHVGQLEMTATATYVLKQLDRSDGWGHWQALEAQVHNFTYRAFWQGKRSQERIDYASKAGTLVAPVADLQIGQNTPGYLLICKGSFPATLKDASAGGYDVPLGLSLGEPDKPGLSGETSGPLPESGTTIHGSRVIVVDVPPFQVGLAGRTRVGVTYVLKPVPLAPLAPKKRR